MTGIFFLTVLFDSYSTYSYHSIDLKTKRGRDHPFTPYIFPPSAASSHDFTLHLNNLYLYHQTFHNNQPSLPVVLLSHVDDHLLPFSFSVFLQPAQRIYTHIDHSPV